MSRLIGVVVLAGGLWAQRYTAFRPQVPEPPSHTSEVPRIMEPRPITPVIVMPPSLKAAYERYVEEQRQKQLVPGYRIQILGTPEKAQADSARFYILENYPSLPVYVVYEVPIYRVRVGDFVNKAEASRWLEILREAFRGAFLVPDQVLKP